MSIFDAAAQLGVFPSGTLLGLGLGALSAAVSLERRLKRPKWLTFTGDMFLTLFCAFCIFMLGVGIEGHLRYPTFCGAALGFCAVRGILHAVKRKK